ncbi:MAG: Mth938-like domain-containing protein [Neisseria sp.]|nr:Mth938-like domain-containing protein [Neisseria sp.]
MQFTEHLHAPLSATHAYAPGSITVGGQTHTEAVLLFADGLRVMPSASWEQLDEMFFTPLLDELGHPELLLLGSGPKQRFLHPKTAAFLASRGVGCESMSTAAACRTLAVLQSEKRNIWALLLP